MTPTKTMKAQRIRPTIAFLSVACLIACLAFALALSSCSGAPDQGGQKGAEGSGKLSVVTSFYPMYDFTKKIGGDRVDVTNLVPAGTEPHDWEPSTTDIKKLEGADVFVYNGADMEQWVDATLASLSNSHLVTCKASEGVSLRTVGAEHGAEGHAADDKNGSADDPHVWLAPENAKAEMANIKDALVKADPDDKDYFEANYQKWAGECDALDQEFKSKLSPLPNKNIVVSHEAFGYLCDAYGLTQTPIEGLDADAEPSAKDLAAITDFVKANNVHVIFSEDLVSPKIAQTIASATGAQVEVLNPVEGLTDEQLAAGDDYFSVMRNNLDKLVKVLS